MIFQHEKAYVKQILIYHEKKEFNHAHNLAQEFAEHFPDSLMAHYLLAKSLYRQKKFPAALLEGHKAFNLAESGDDRVATGVFLACVCYELKRFSRGYEILKSIEKLEDERIEKAMFILSLCKNEPETAMMHVDELYHINKQVAEDFVDRFLEFAGGTGERVQLPVFGFQF